MIPSGTVQPFTTAAYTDGQDTADYATVSVNSGSILFRMDGQDPNTTEGHPADDTVYKNVVIRGRDAIKKFRARGLSDAKLFVTYEINKSGY